VARRHATRAHRDRDGGAALRLGGLSPRESNAIVFAQGTATVGIGGGQPNRVDCVRIAAERSGERPAAPVCASDAFFRSPTALRPRPAQA
jgi:phosphoribosylaminoimidazolecarboxamide formyltransferase/IMP cyclohydrolase